jgi:hypothetical protein
MMRYCINRKIDRPQNSNNIEAMKKIVRLTELYAGVQLEEQIKDLGIIKDMMKVMREDRDVDLTFNTMSYLYYRIKDRLEG